MQTLESQPLAQGLVFGEGPRWRDGKLWVSDMHAHRVMTVDEAGFAADQSRSTRMCSILLGYGS